MYLCLDGIEGCGKSSLVAKLAADYNGLKIIEPGQTEYGKTIRKLLLFDNQGDMSPMTELLLFMADRNHTWTTITKPALVAGRLVISDRSFASSFAYQCVAEGLEPDRLMNVLKELDLEAPDKVVIIDLPVWKAKQRIKKIDRFEKMEESFHEKVRQGFLVVGDLIVNGDQSFDDVYAELIAKLPELEAFRE
jgi:dTMP kinase